MAKRYFFQGLLVAAALSFFSVNSAWASFEQGKEAYERKNWQQAIYYLRPLAESGDARAMIVLGNMYSQGLGVAQDDKEAFSLYLKAARLNHPDAMAAVGAMYQQGRGTAKNLKYALGWYGRAAQAGQNTAATLYAMLLYRGNRSDDKAQELIPDHVESYKWFTIAARQTQNKKTQATLRQMASKVAENLAHADIAKADSAATVWKPVATEALGPFPEEADSAAEDSKAPLPPQ